MEPPIGCAISQLRLNPVPNVSTIFFWGQKWLKNTEGSFGCDPPFPPLIFERSWSRFHGVKAAWVIFLVLS